MKFKRALSWFLSLIMVLSLVPDIAFAYNNLAIPASGQRSAPKAYPDANWEVAGAEEIDDEDFWPLQAKSKPRTVNQHEPIKVIDLTFDGSYVTAERTEIKQGVTEIVGGETVIRLKQYLRFGAVSSVWDHISYRFDKDLYDMIDFDKSFIYKSDSDASNQHIKFVQRDEKNTRSLKLFGNEGFADAKSASANYDMPINLYLKKGKTMDDLKALKKDLVIQSRIYNEDETNVYTTKFIEGIGEGNTTDVLGASYNSYTKTLIIPLLNEVYTDAIEKQPFYSNYANDLEFIHGTTGFTIYDPVNGKLKIATGYTKEGSVTIDKDKTAFRQNYGKGFLDLLKEDSNDVIGRVYTANRALEYNPKYQVIKKEDINVDEKLNLNYIVVANNAFELDKGGENGVKIVRAKEFNQNVIQQGLDALAPVWTVVEYDLDKNKVEGRFQKDKFLLNFGVKSEFIGSTGDDFREYSFYTDTDIEIPKDQFLKVRFKNPLNSPFKGRNAEIFLKIGEKEKAMTYGYIGYHNISNNNENGFEKLYFNYEGNGGNNYRIKFREGMKIPSGTKISIFTSARDDKYDDFTVTMGKKIYETKNMTSQLKKVDRIFPYVLRGSGKDFSIQFVKNNILPVVDEVFTDSTNFTGYTYYPASTVLAKYENILKEKQSNGQDNKSKVLVGGKEYTGYKFDILNDSEVAEGSQPGPIALKKDMRLKFRSTRPEMVPGDFVDEQVQAKVNFDPNGGTISNGREDVLVPVTKIVPLNEKFADEEGYKANGFEGENIKKEAGALLDHNGKVLTGEKLEMRKFPQVPKLEGKTFIGWSTKKIEAGNRAQIQVFRDLKPVKTADEWNDNIAQKIDANSPILEAKTLYAVWSDELVIRLHRNSTNEDTVVYEIPISKEEAETGKITLPRAYDNSSMDEKLKKDFKLEGKTFAGWKLSKEDKVDLAKSIKGTDGQHIREVALKDIVNVAGTRLIDGVTISLGDNWKDLIKDGSLELYAIYAPYIDVTAEKIFRENSVDQMTGPTINIGLLYRTAVTNYGDPTIADQAAYFVPQDAYKNDQEAYAGYNTGGDSLQPIPKNAMLKYYSSKKGHTKDDLSWKVRGYDENGDRLSYIAVEVPADKTPLGTNASKYYNYDQNWKSLGITVNPGASYTQTGKEQILNIPKDTGEVDTYSGATVRTVNEGQVNNDLDTVVTAYHFKITNTKLDTKKPVIKNVYNGENSFDLIENIDKTVKFIKVKLRTNKANTPGGEEKDYLFKQTSENVWKLVDQQGLPLETSPLKAEYDNETKVLKVSYTEEGKTFVGNANQALSDDIEVIYNLGTLTDPVDSEMAKTSVFIRPESGKVVEIAQKPNIDKNTDDDKNFDTVVIEGKRPSDGINVPANGTEYVIGKLVDGVFTPIQKDGEDIKVPFDQNNSTVKFEIPKDILKDKDKLVIKSVEPEPKTPVFSEEITLDLKAPEVVEKTAEDGGYRMFIDIKAKIDNTVDIRENKITIKVDEETYKVEPKHFIPIKEDTDKDPKTPEVVTGYNLDFESIIKRRPDTDTKAPVIKLFVVDKLNNENIVEIPYTAVVKGPSFEVSEAFAGDDYVFVEPSNGSSIDNIEVAVKREGMEVVNTGKKAYTDAFIDLEKDGEPFELEKGDLIVITVTGGGITVSPQKFIVR